MAKILGERRDSISTKNIVANLFFIDSIINIKRLGRLLINLV
jgi:hypothetical protein